MTALLDLLERRAEERYGRGAVVETEPVAVLLVRVAVRNPDGAIVTSAIHQSRTQAILVLLRSFGEEVTF